MCDRSPSRLEVVGGASRLHARLLVIRIDLLFPMAPMTGARAHRGRSDRCGGDGKGGRRLPYQVTPPSLAKASPEAERLKERAWRAGELLLDILELFGARIS